MSNQGIRKNMLKSEIREHRYKKQTCREQCHFSWFSFLPHWFSQAGATFFYQVLAIRTPKPDKVTVCGHLFHQFIQKAPSAVRSRRRWDWKNPKDIFSKKRRQRRCMNEAMRPWAIKLTLLKRKESDKRLNKIIHSLIDLREVLPVGNAVGEDTNR